MVHDDLRQHTHTSQGDGGSTLGPIDYLSLLTYTPTNLPTDQPTGTLFFDSHRAIPAWWDGNNHEWPSFVDNQDVQTSTQTVSNTTDETEVLQFTINAGALKQGRVFILRCYGKYTTASSNDDFTYRVYIGDSGFDPTGGEGTKIAEVTTVQENVTDGPWLAKNTSTVFTDAASGELQSHLEASFNNAKKDDHTASVTVDTTTAEDIVATVEWNNAKSGNSVERGQAYLQQQA